MSLGQKGIRASARLPVELPVQIRWKSPAGVERFAQGKTESISGNGVFIAAPVRLRRNMPITFTVTLPAEVTNVPMQLQCVGRVVRQYRTAAPAGVGVVIDDYRFSALKPPV